jgi:hypothetical protein
VVRPKLNWVLVVLAIVAFAIAVYAILSAAA